MPDRSSLSARRRQAIRAACELQPLEQRSLLAATMSTVSPGTLLIEGTEGADVISIRTRSSRLDVRINGALQTFTTRSVARIEIQAYDGNDVADWSTIAIPTYINAGLGNDLVYGGSGNDSLTGAAGKDTLYGNGGVDRINGANSNDVLYGGDGDDVIYGGAANDYIDGGTGRDRVWAEDGDDSLIGGLHNDALYGGAGRDRILGQRGADILSGDSGNDVIYGGDDADQIYGGAGVDNLYGEAGDDLLYADGDGSVDNLFGDAGRDGGKADPTDNLTGTEAVAAGSPRALSFNDEALTDANFESTVAQAKTLGVKAVRLWLDINDYNDRPQAWDNITTEQLAYKWQGNHEDRAETAGLTIKRAFELKAAGFSVLLTVNRYGGTPPASDAEVRGLFTHLVNATYTPSSTLKFKDVIDYWEIGNEVDLTYYWNPPVATWQERLESYVTDLFMPAADILHDSANGVNEKVVLGSICWASYNLDVLLDYVQANGAMNDVDHVGFHTYASFSTDPSADRLAENIIAANGMAAAYGKKLISTEWNLRNFALDGSQDTAWATQIDRVYRELILPNFELAFYFAMVNNYDGRGGNVSARPAGLLVHDTTLNVSPASNLNTLVQYYNSPLVPSTAFYSMFNNLPRGGDLP